MAIEYRWAENQLDDCRRWRPNWFSRRVTVIVDRRTCFRVRGQGGNHDDPYRLRVGEDPVRRGLVTSLARPGGNLTGINFFAGELAAKRLELLRRAGARGRSDCRARQSGQYPEYRVYVERRGAAARAMGLQVQVFNASTSREIDAVFASLVRERPDALFVASDPSSRPARPIGPHGNTTRYPQHITGGQYAEVGGLMSYGTNLTDAFRQVGTMPAASSRARSRRTCRWCSRPSSSWSSSLRPPGCSASPCRRRCSPAPTR